MTTEDIAELVSSHPVFAGLPGDTHSLVAGCAHNVAFAAGEHLLHEGEPRTRSTCCAGDVSAWSHRSPAGGLWSSTFSAPGRPLAGRGCSRPTAGASTPAASSR